MDVVVPRSRLPETFRKISQMGHHAGYQVGYLAHAGDGNIHPEIFCDLGETGALERVHVSCKIRSSAISSASAAASPASTASGWRSSATWG